MTTPTPPEGYRIADRKDDCLNTKAMLWIDHETKWHPRFAPQGSPFSETHVYAVPIEPPHAPEPRTMTPGEIADALWDSFEWMKSPQGYVYWLKVSQQLRFLDKPTPPEPPRAKVGDWVQFKSVPWLKPFEVVRVDSEYAIGHSRNAIHGSYEIVRRVVTPWNMQQACEALGNHRLIFRDEALHEWDVYALDKHGVVAQDTEDPIERRIFGFRKLAERCTLPDGTPCGNVEWEVVK